MVKRAIISVYDKKGIVEFAKGLKNLGIEIISTGGTYKLLKEKGIEVINVSDYIDFPEIFKGRVKTLHPKIHAGILGFRDEDMREQGIDPIDMVVVNLYPFEDTVKKGGTLEEAIEMIDIGGPTLIRAASKNYKYVTVIVDPADYEDVINEMNINNGELSINTKFKLAKKGFKLTAGYDDYISNYLSSLNESIKFPETLNLQFSKIIDLRYGENPHQKAAFYGILPVNPFIKLYGKELSYNNILDFDSAVNILKEFNEKVSVIIKHNNPCGFAKSDVSLIDAYKKAIECDPMSAFGGIVGINGIVDKELAMEITSIFVEGVIAPEYRDDALDILKTKKNIIILKMNKRKEDGIYDIRKAFGGIVVQDRDLDLIKELKIVTERKPTIEEMEDMNFAWKVCKYVKSNGIVFAKNGQIIGIGAGQMSRVDSVKIAIMKANIPIKGSVMASDAFFPFRDSVDIASEVGITGIIQPGGSIRDKEVIKAANEHNMSMIFTGVRHFRH